MFYKFILIILISCILFAQEEKENITNYKIIVLEKNIDS
ncbi:hypothetical protein AF80_09645 [Aliarcobacter butzleri L355]|uniref:Uncharacterized protein n=1 Tax=Aliarcobacter butzleri L355 TaxID=1447263 RepID=A0A0G9KPM0_9BACT|nr:hypothetical protein AF80_09645 [Aliarcobacter butzleri L355]